MALKDESIQKFNTALNKIGFAIHQQKLWKKTEEEGIKEAADLDDLIVKLNKEEADAAAKAAAQTPPTKTPLQAVPNPVDVTPTAARPQNP